MYSQTDINVDHTDKTKTTSNTIEHKNQGASDYRSHLVHLMVIS